MKSRDPKPIVPAPGGGLVTVHPCTICGLVKAKRSGMKCAECVQELVERAKLTTMPTVLASMEAPTQPAFVNVGRIGQKRRVVTGNTTIDDRVAAKKAKARARKARQKANKRLGNTG